MLTWLWVSNHTERGIFHGSVGFFSPVPHLSQGNTSKNHPCGAYAASHSIPALPWVSPAASATSCKMGHRPGPVFHSVPILPAPSYYTRHSNVFILLSLSDHRGGASRSAHQESCDYVLLSYLTQQRRLYQLISAEAYVTITCVLQWNIEFHLSLLLPSFWLRFCWSSSMSSLDHSQQNNM